MSSLLPYILPVLTLMVVGVFFLGDGSITSFSVFEPGINSVIKIQTSTDMLVPENSLVKITLGNQEASMTVKEFIQRAGGDFDYIYGKLDQVGYEGYGYIGDYEYKLNLKYFEINRELPDGDYILKTEVVYNNFILASEEIEINV